MEITIINNSEASINKRFDAEFFRPQYMKSFNEVSKSNYQLLSIVSNVSDGNHLKIAEEFNLEHGVRYLRGQDLSTDMILQDRNIVYIPENTYDQLKRSHIYKDDILITIVGANTGLVGLVYDPPEKLVANCKLGIVRPKKSKILSGYLYSFLIGKYGQHQIYRSIRGGGQTGLILPDLRNLLITRLSEEFEKMINKIVLNGHERIIKSNSIYNDTEQLLIQELDQPKWRANHELSFINNYSDTQKTERIDAEYFQPKYDEIINAIKNYKGGWDLLGNLVKIKKCIEPGSSTYEDSGIPFVRVSDLSKFEIAFGNTEYISESLYESLKTHQPKKDEILLSKDATPGIAFHLREIPPKMIPSGGILRLTIKDKNRINEEYLTLVLNSLIVQQQMLRDSGGSVIYHWRPDQIKNVMIPLVDENTQKGIKSRISGSFDNRKKSKRLLEIAKRGVEIAIEKDENTAQKWIDEQLKINNLSLITTDST